MHLGSRTPFNAMFCTFFSGSNLRKYTSRSEIYGMACNLCVTMINPIQMLLGWSIHTINIPDELQFPLSLLQFMLVI